MNKPEYNDINLNIKEETLSYIREQSKELDIEIDGFLLHHIANIFKRDILIVHDKFKDMTDEENTIF